MLGDSVRASAQDSLVSAPTRLLLSGDTSSSVEFPTCQELAEWHVLAYSTVQLGSYSVDGRL